VPTATPARSRRPSEALRDGFRQADRVAITQAKVFVRGRVPREFLDWVERGWGRDGETRTVLRG